MRVERKASESRRNENEGFRLWDRTKGLDTNGVRTRGRARGR